jgi:hypothetical protein
MGLYYRIWVDCITRLRSIEANKDNWQTKGIIAMSTAMTFNFVLLMVIFQKNILDYYFYEINIASLSGFQNYILTILILYFLPCVIINYLLIFRNKRYEKLLKKYPYSNGKFIVAYILISMLLPSILLLIAMFILP